MKTIDAARGHWEYIFNHYRVNGYGQPNKHFDCPLCGGKKKFRFSDVNGNGDWICVCGNGNGFDLIQQMKGMSFLDVANEIDKLIGNTPALVPAKPKKIDRVNELIRTTMINPTATNSQYYLQERGIINLPEMCIYHCNSVPLYNSDAELVGNYEAMIAIVTDVKTMDVIQYHITYLNGIQKIARKVRNINGSIEGKRPVVRLREHGKVLGVAEGIETTNSCFDIYKIPTWSTINSDGMKKFRAPSGVSRMVVYADNDTSITGLAAAFECGRANILSPNDVKEVEIVWPKEFIDFNDLEDPTQINTHRVVRIK